MRRHDSHLTDEDLLRLIDDELPARRHLRVQAHLDLCAACRARRGQMDRITALVGESYVQDIAAAEIGRARQGLHASLAAMTQRLNRSWAFVLESMLAATPAWALLAAVTATSLLALDLQTRSGHEPAQIIASAEDGALPISSLTPGATLSLGPADLCVEDRRPRQHRLPASVRQDVLRQYRMEHVSQTEYELDFLITPDLGGAAETANLWPERYGLPTWNARVKDQLEELLPQLVCNGTVRLELAQRDIAVDWIAAYKKYFNTSAPLAPKTARFAPDRDEIVFEEAGPPVLVLATFSPSAALRSGGRH